VRFGRPPKELAGEVDERVLDAARKIFLERGFEGASIDEIAEAARSGKQTIYARFRNKRELQSRRMGPMLPR
jgi:AcrR family transcriptional regulator